MFNKPKEYPQQPETKTVAKHAMSEVCLLVLRHNIDSTETSVRMCKSRTGAHMFIDFRCLKTISNCALKWAVPKYHPPWGGDAINQVGLHTTISYNFIDRLVLMLYQYGSHVRLVLVVAGEPWFLMFLEGFQGLFPAIKIWQEKDVQALQEQLLRGPQMKWWT